MSNKSNKTNLIEKRIPIKISNKKEMMKKEIQYDIPGLTTEGLNSLRTWDEFYNSGCDIQDLRYNLSWHIMFTNLIGDKKFPKLIEEHKKKATKTTYPPPDLLLSAFIITPLDRLSVVFVGQDPYFNENEAMGLSFSVPHNTNIPSSLQNIFSNLVNHGHLRKKPESGNLWFWAAQGCLMLNSALTVEKGEKGSNLKMWEWYTDYIINYISKYMDGIVFVLWGAYAYDKRKLIDIDRHHIIVSSHPSGLSANKPFGIFPAFMQEDHFGKINNYLIKQGKKPIVWGFPSVDPNYKNNTKNNSVSNNSVSNNSVSNKSMPDKSMSKQTNTITNKRLIINGNNDNDTTSDKEKKEKIELLRQNRIKQHILNNLDSLDTINPFDNANIPSKTISKTTKSGTSVKLNHHLSNDTSKSKTKSKTKSKNNKNK